MKNTPFPANLRARREYLGLTLQAASVEMGVALTTWHRWERGVSEPDFATLGRIAELLGTSPARLLREVTPITRESTK